MLTPIFSPPSCADQMVPTFYKEKKAPCIRKTHAPQNSFLIVHKLLVEFPCRTLIVFFLLFADFYQNHYFDTTSSTCTIVFRLICPPHHLDFKSHYFMIFEHQLQTINSFKFPMFSPCFIPPLTLNFKFPMFPTFFRFSVFFISGVRLFILKHKE